MRIKLSIIALMLTGFIFSRCTIGPPPPQPVSEFGPYIRVGIAENLESISFETNDDIDIWDQNDLIIASEFPGKRWQVRLADTAPVNLKYRLLYREVNNQADAERVAATLRDRGYTPVVTRIKNKMVRNGEFVSAFSYQIFLNSVFYSNSEAKQYQTKITDQVTTTILPFFDSRPKGRVILINQDSGERFQSPGLIRVWGNRFTLKVLEGEGFHFEREVERTYWRQLEFWIDWHGGITVVKVTSSN